MATGSNLFAAGPRNARGTLGKRALCTYGRENRGAPRVDFGTRVVRIFAKRTFIVYPSAPTGDRNRDAGEYCPRAELANVPHRLKCTSKGPADCGAHLFEVIRSS